MTRLEKIQKIKELLAKKEGLSAEQRLKFGQVLAAEEKKEVDLEANKANPEPSFSARIGASPFEGMMNAITEYNRKKGVSSGEQAEMMKQGLLNAADIGTGAGLVRAGVGELAGGSYVDSPEAIVQSLTQGVPTDILEKEKVLEGSPKTQWIADALLNVADPGALALGAGLLKQGIQSGGKKLYQSGLKNIDKLTLKKGKGMNAFSDTAMKYGIAGTSEDVMNQTDDVLETLMKERDAIFNKATQKGAVVDSDKVLKPVIKEAEGLASNKKVIDKNVKKQASDMAENLKEFSEANKYVPEQDLWKVSEDLPQQDKMLPATIGDDSITLENQLINEQGGLTPSESSGVKTQLYNMMGSEPYSILRQDTKGQGLLKRAASRFNTATTAAVRKVDPKAAKRLREINKDMGALLTGRPAAFNEFSKEVTKNAITSVDAPLAILNPAAYLGKKAADIGKTAAFRTQAGKLLSDDMVAKILGGTGALAAKGAINAYRGDEK